MCKAMQENYDEGLAEGMAKGLKKGRKKGQVEGRETTAVNLLRRGGFPLDEIAEIAVLPVERIIELKAELEKEEWKKRGKRDPRQWPS